MFVLLEVRSIVSLNKSKKMIKQLKDVVVARMRLRKSEKMLYKDLKSSLMTYNGRNEKFHGIHFVNGKTYEVSAQYDFDRGMVRVLIKDTRKISN